MKHIYIINPAAGRGDSTRALTQELDEVYADIPGQWEIYHTTGVGDATGFVRERCRTDRAFRQKTLHALQESGIDGWRPLHPARTSKKEDTAHADARI